MGYLDSTALAGNLFFKNNLSSCCLNCCRKNQTVVASGTGSASPKPKNLMNDSGSLTWYSSCSSLMLYSCCSISILNMTIGSIGFRPALFFLGLSCTCSKIGRNYDHGTLSSNFINRVFLLFNFWYRCSSSPIFFNSMAIKPQLLLSLYSHLASYLLNFSRCPLIYNSYYYRYTKVQLLTVLSIGL